FYVMMPSVSKTGVYDNETKTITWTIVVRPELFDDADFTVTDIPDPVLSSAVSAVFGADMTISKSDMELQPDGSYVYKFSTVVPDSVLDNITETKLSNKAEVHFDDTADTPEYDKGAEGSVSIPGSLTDFVHKSAGTPADEKMPWTVVVSVPDVDVEKLVVSDYISNTISGEATKLDPTSVKVTVTGDPNVYTVVSDGSRYHIVLKDGSDVVTDVVGVFDWYVSNESMKMEFYDVEYYLNGNTYVSDWFSGCRNKDITITFDSALADEVLYCKNTATATLTIDSSSVSDSDDAEFVKDFNASKSALALNNIHYGYKDQLVHPLVWMIGVSSENYQPGDVITVTDKVPEGFEYVSDSAIVHIGSGDHYISANADYQSQLTVTESADGSQVTFSVVVNDKMIAALTTGNLYTIKIAYITNMTDEEHLAFETSTSAVTYTNTASVKVNTESPIEISSSQTLMPNPQNLVAKGVTSSGQEADKNFYAYYSVVINGEELPLNGGNNMTATDTLGSNLTLVGTPVITPNDSGEVATYSGNTITFANLKDSTRYTITYKVKVKQIFKNDVYTDEEIADMFSNSISVGVNGGTSVSSEFLIDESTYRSQGEYRHDEMKSSITISGTKSWIDEGVNKGARPAKIVISLEKTEYDEDDNKVGESKVTEYIVNAPVDADGNWTYTIEDLITEDFDGHTYKYNVKEVTVDGYSVSYTGSVKDITSTTLDAEHTVAITNKFTADEKETGSVVVKKVWTNDTAADRPAEIVITLTDEYGAEISKTLASTDGSVRFDDLPLYKYSRNDDGTLKREPRKYFLTESCDAAYADKMARYTSVCPEGFYLTEEDLGKDVALSAPVEKTITNTRMTIGPVVLIKTYTDTDLAALTEAKRNEILSATVFTLYSDSACTNAVGTASPVYSAGEAIVTFSADIVENTTYYLKETSVHADYEISSDVFECRIDADGKVTYKKQGSSDAYSDRFPVCENALIKTPGTITLIKTYEDTVVASLSTLARNMLLSATKFTLYSDEACTTEVVTAAPQYSSGIVKVVFADGLAIDTTYYLKETASPSSYKLSTDVFECRIDADGNVTYKKQGSSDEYSATFPVCENALKPTPGKITLIKTYSDTDLAALTEDARNSILSATVFTLYSDAECTVAVGTASPVYTADGASVEFSKGLSLDTVYYLKETSAHKDYEKSSDVFECKIDADGKVTYKKQGSSDAYSEAFPECENTFIKRPGSVSIIKTYENTNLHVMPSVGRDNILSATEFTLYSDAECTVVVAVASPEYKEGRAIVEFNDGLELGKTY
ncbi:MAG: Cna B-type domain-containing protein, partial [Oscillospiraceae bacterium]|nr:Cna B-type domain-containing protein [Oscillospiraceae bacterium]